MSPIDFDRDVRSVPDWPKKGVDFKDWSPLLAQPGAWGEMIDLLFAQTRDKTDLVDYVVGAEARGFVLGPGLADRFNAGFVPVRKPGKTPPDFHSHSYDLEYGQDTIELAHDLVPEKSRVLFHDDLLATGGTALAAAHLIEKIGAELVGFSFAFEINDLPGRETLESFGAPVICLHSF